jgi:hypothetical protein
MCFQKVVTIRCRYKVLTYSQVVQAVRRTILFWNSKVHYLLKKIPAHQMILPVELEPMTRMSHSSVTVRFLQLFGFSRRGSILHNTLYVLCSIVLSFASAFSSHGNIFARFYIRPYQIAPHGQTGSQNKMVL